MTKVQQESEGRGRTALVTGASAGIGKVFAEFLAEKGFDIVLTARREERLNTLAQEISSLHSVRTEVIVTDLADPKAPQNICDALSEKNISIDVLVNNAGYSISASFSDASLQAQLDLIQVMATSVVQLCHLLLPNMKKNRYGRIINVSSIAAFLPPAPGKLYTGIKSFVMDFSIALSLELEGTGVFSTALCPGFTHSEFHDAMGVRAQVNKIPSFMWMETKTVVKQGYYAAMKGEKVYINGKINRFLSIVFRLLPNKFKYKATRNQSLTQKPKTNSD